MSMSIQSSKGKSPYSKYLKAPYKYGEHYERWNHAVTTHGRYSEEAMAADLAFRRYFDIPTLGVNAIIDGSSFDV